MTRMDSPELVEKLKLVALHQVVVSTDYFRPSSPNPAEFFRMFLGMLYEGGLSKDEIKRLAGAGPGPGVISAPGLKSQKAPAGRRDSGRILEILGQI